jgi:hypothetical protein
VYFSYLMLRNLAPRGMTAGEQREADEQLGQIAAAAARWGHRLAAQVHAVAAQPPPDRHRPAARRRAGPARRRVPYRA